MQRKEAARRRAEEEALGLSICGVKNAVRDLGFRVEKDSQNASVMTHHMRTHLYEPLPLFQSDLHLHVFGGG